MEHKSGFVNIIGNANVGKSTLMNALTGEKLSIITSKVQTTRHRIKGIINGDDFQIVYSDTPGILNPHNGMHKNMLKTILNATEDADVFLYIVEAGLMKVDEDIIKKVKDSGVPVILVINKIDISNQIILDKTAEYWHEQFPDADIVSISALLKVNIESIFNLILEKLPVGEPYFPKDQLTDSNLRFFTSEIIREKILLNYKKEIPYSVEVVVEQFKELENITHISAMIYVARESQKMILIGEKGNAIKRVGIEARLDLEEFLQTKIFIELRVKVSDNWLNNELQLKRFGYSKEV